MVLFQRKTQCHNVRSCSEAVLEMCIMMMAQLQLTVLYSAVMSRILMLDKKIIIKAILCPIRATGSTVYCQNVAKMCAVLTEAQFQWVVISFSGDVAKEQGPGQ